MGEIKTAIQWTELSDDKKKEIQKHFQTMKAIRVFSTKANEKLFIFLFGERMGKHYWVKFASDFKRDISAFISYIDDSNAAILFANIFSEEERFTWDSHPLYANCL